MLKNIKLLGNPKVLIPEDANIASTAFTSKEGEKILYKGGQAPSPWNVTPMPAHITAQPAQVQAEMMDIMGLHSVSLGKRAVGASSGKAIDALSENDTSQLQLAQMDIEYGVQCMARDVLIFMKEFYTKKKAMRMMDSTGGIIFAQIQATDLLENPEIFLEAGSLFHSEAEDRDAKTMKLLQAQLITPDEAKKALSYRTDALGVLDQIRGLQHAKEVLESVVHLGAPIRVYPTDDLDAFVKVFKQFMVTPEFYTLPIDRQDAVESAFPQVLNTKNPPPAGQPAGLGGMGPQPTPTGAPDASQGLNQPLPPMGGAQAYDHAVEQQETAPEAANLTHAG